MKVIEVMNKAVKVIRPDSTVKEAAVIMNQYKIGSVVVVSLKGELEGIITERDILEDIVAQGKNSEEVKVEEIMTKKEDMKIVSPNADLDDAAEIMTENKIRKLPVVHGGKLIGIVTASDLIAFEEKMIEKVAELFVVGKKMTSIAG